MSINRTPYNALIDDDGSNTVGTVWDKALVATVLLDPIDAEFAARATAAGTALAAEATARDAAIAARVPSTLTAHGLVVGNGTSPVVATAAGTAGQVLTSNGASADPTFQAAASGGMIGVASTVTGAQHDYAPGLTGDTLIQWTGASAAAFTGLAGGVAGRRVVFKNTGAAIATFAHGSGSSTGGNKFMNFATSAPTPIAPGGAIAYVHDGLRWLVVAHHQGAWIKPAYNAADFIAATGTWTVDTGDVVLMHFVLSGRTLLVCFTLNTTSLSAASASLSIANAAWGGFSCSLAQVLTSNILLSDAGAAYATGSMQIGTAALDPTKILMYRPTFANWSIATNTTSIFGLISFEVT